MARHALRSSHSARVIAGGLTLAATASLAIGLMAPGASAATTVISVPGTDDPDGADNLERTVNLIGVDPADVTTVFYPTGFGIGKPGVFVLPLVKAAWNETYNSSVEKGTSAAIDAIVAAPGDTIIAVGHSQGSRALGNAGEIIQRDDLVPGKTVLLVLLADPAFPVTGAENVMPSFIPGLYTGGSRTPGSADSNVKIVSVCIKTDPTCGFKPYELSSWFYLPAGFLMTHSKDYANLADNAVASTWTVGNTTYVVLEPGNGENPYGALLRSFGLPVPLAFDKLLTALMPYSEPGTRTSVGGVGLPTPREVQQALFDQLGVAMPNTTVVEPRDDGYSVSVPSTVATGATPTDGVVVSNDQPAADSSEPTVPTVNQPLDHEPVDEVPTNDDVVSEVPTSSAPSTESDSPATDTVDTSDSQTAPASSDNVEPADGDDASTQSDATTDTSSADSDTGSSSSSDES